MNAAGFDLLKLIFDEVGASQGLHEWSEETPRYAVLAEEVGEVIRAAADGKGEQEIRAELIQVMAVAWRMLTEGLGEAPGKRLALGANVLEQAARDDLNAEEAESSVPYVSDLLKLFIEERCVRDEKRLTLVDALWDDFSLWLEGKRKADPRYRGRFMSPRVFLGNLESLGLFYRYDENVVAGIALKGQAVAS